MLIMTRNGGDLVRPSSSASDRKAGSSRGMTYPNPGISLLTTRSNGQMKAGWGQPLSIRAATESRSSFGFGPVPLDGARGPADPRRVDDTLAAFSQPFPYQDGRTGGPDHPDRPAFQGKISVSHQRYPPSHRCPVAPACGATAGVALTVACVRTPADGEPHEVGAGPDEELRRMARKAASAAITTAAAVMTISRLGRVAGRRSRVTPIWRPGITAGSAGRCAVMVLT